MSINLELQELKELLGGSSSKPVPHIFHGQRVVVALPHGFIFFGTLHDASGGLSLIEASNLRYWSKRDGGLPEFAMKGPRPNDKIDKVGTVAIHTPIFMYQTGEWHE